ncbi:MAG: deoxyguanosinetriphosphate triphosphohydrolase [Arcanobacterium sp.]|nr:deoxyguanosinetriphosphate triphosphohydrolase [Arcanobacterium sp.]
MLGTYLAEDKQRFAPEGEGDSHRGEFERDRARVLHSAALRRLGAKTQVLGPESNDFIRTRLTHSLEVAQIGRALATNLGADPDIVETACLSHDIGHPPFGHNGERALDEVAKDFGGFEGNAQTLRVLTKLEPKRFRGDGTSAGLNLTRATLDAVIKYPWLRFAGPKGDASPKFGAYPDDEEIFTWAHENRGPQRCIEAQMMDLADDIAYSVHDVEDGIVRGAIRPEEFRTSGLSEELITQTQSWYGARVTAQELVAAFERLSKMPTWPTEFFGGIRDLAQLKDLTSDLIGRFILNVTAATRAEFGAEPLTRYRASVIIPQETIAEITLLKGMAVHFVMAPRENEPTYFEQRTIIFDLFDAINENPQEYLEPAFGEFWKSAESDADRNRVVMDQIASLTDQSARMWHARLCGMLRN